MITQISAGSSDVVHKIAHLHYCVKTETFAQSTCIAWFVQPRGLCAVVCSVWNSQLALEMAYRPSCAATYSDRISVFKLFSDTKEHSE